MLYDKLNEYSKSGVYPFHMPGHKRNFEYDLPYDLDITEINDFDNLHNANGCIDEIQKRAAEVYKVKKAFALVNGSTCGILAAIRAMTNYSDTVIIARNCHKSVYNAIELCGLNAVYITPETDREFEIFGSVNPSDVEKALSENKNAKLVIVTSPTYEGVTSDINSISEICHKYGARLFVDEAHGAHFPFSDRFPKSAEKCGADVLVTSLHKTLPSLTQTALLLCNNEGLILPLAENLSFFESSSPSYILMSSIGCCIEFLESCEEKFKNYIRLLDDFSSKSKNLKNIKILCHENSSLKNHDFFDFDISKVVISLKQISLNGKEFAEILREKYKIELEMSNTSYAVAITSVCDTKEGLDRLYNALYEIDFAYGKSYENAKKACFVLPEKVFNSSDRNKYSGEYINFKEAENKISLEYLWVYPPGIPLLVPGERINKDLIVQISKMKRNGAEVLSSNAGFSELSEEIYTVK